LNRIIRQEKDGLRFAYRHFPLSEEHPYALIAAEASESASAQGKFWDMFNKIFQNQDVLDVDHLYEFAQSIGLDMNRFDSDLKNHVYEEKVRADFMSGVRSGVNGTPTLFINGKRYEGPMESDSLMQAIQEAAEITQA
jgi:protein-disulfide isomerase